MREIVLKPGWLKRDTERAAARLKKWAETTRRLTEKYPPCISATEGKLEWKLHGEPFGE